MTIDTTFTFIVKVNDKSELRKEMKTMENDYKLRLQDFNSPLVVVEKLLSPVIV
ncbi:MAG: hypothetical protein ACI96W_001565 [Paraglaciecola sp.]|jgi:hypothetical protein